MGKIQTRRWTLAITITTAATCCFAAVSFQLMQRFHDEVRPAGILYWPSLLLSGLCMCFFALLSLLCWDVLRLKPADSLPFTTLKESYKIIRKTYYFGPGAIRKYLDGCINVATVQEMYLLNLLDHNKGTSYGMEKKFRNIKSVKNFQNQHPIIRHKNIKPHINRIAEGEKNVLTKEEPLYFAKTSGTTGQPKLVPITMYMSDQHGRDLGYMYGYMPAAAGAKLTLGKTVILGHKPQVDTTKSGLQVAPLTYFYIAPSPAHTSPKEVYAITHENSSFYVHALFALLEREVANLRLLFAHQAYSFFTFLEEQWESLCNDIECGSISRDSLVIDDNLYNDISELLQPDPERAQELRTEFRKGNVHLAKRIWPDLEYCVVTTTGSMAVYGDLIEKTYLKDVILIQNGYGASEGFYGMNLQDVTHDTNFVLTYPYAFFEFIPESMIEEEQPSTVLAHEVKGGCNYELVITNGLGIHRYRTEDVVKITQFIYNCPVMEFQYRAGQVLNLLGEKTTDIVFYKALCNAVDKLGVTLIDYTTCEDIHLHDIADIDRYTRHYVLFIELNKKLSKEETKQFDASLCLESEIYSGMRRGRQSVAGMQVIQVRAGAFLLLKQHMIRYSQNPQFKMPRSLRVKPLLSLLLTQRLGEGTGTQL